MAFLVTKCLLCVFFVINSSFSEVYCPEKCICDSIATKLKLTCGGSKNPVAFVEEIHFDRISSDILKLNLSSNRISNLTKIARLPSLRKLDLSKNRISFIETGVFLNIPDLKQLDLSHNLLTTLKQGLFENLPALKQIDISSNPLICDCDLIWTIEFLQNKSVKLLSNPKCTFPKTEKVHYLKKTKPGMHTECNLAFEPEEPTTIHLRPTEDQIVFEGDSLRLHCQISGIGQDLTPGENISAGENLPGADISWSWSYENSKSSNGGGKLSEGVRGGENFIFGPEEKAGDISRAKTNGFGGSGVNISRSWSRENSKSFSEGGKLPEGVRGGGNFSFQPEEKGREILRAKTGENSPGVDVSRSWSHENSRSSNGSGKLPEGGRRVRGNEKEKAEEVSRAKTGGFRGFGDVGVEVRRSQGVVDSSLVISRLKSNHSGLWTCQISSRTARNQTRGVWVFVISNGTKFCPFSITSDNKGVYSWPKTMVGFLVDLPCSGNPSGPSRAFRKCTKSASWKNLNTSACPYISETTRILEQFSKVNLTLTKVNVVESAVHLKRNYTEDIKVLRDKMDLVFISRTVYNYLEFLSKEKELSRILSDIINNLLDLPKSFLQEAEKEDKSLQKLVKSAEIISDYLATISRKFFAIQEFRFKRETFHGLSCTWYVENVVRQSPRLHCGMVEDWEPVDQSRMIEARVQIPDANFQGRNQEGFGPTVRLFMAFYVSSKFFLSQFANGTDSYTGVVGVKLVNTHHTENLTYPISIMMRLTATETTTEASGPPIPAWWDPSLNRGHGGWSPSGCHATHIFHDFLVFQCHNLGYYTVLQRISTTPEVFSSFSGAKFRLGHPAVYIGAFVLFSTLITCILTFLLCFSSINMPKKVKHCVMNIWAAVTFLVFMFTFGIHQTEDVKTCQIVGIIIHYLSLSVLLWLCVALNNMYKRLKAPETILTDENLEGAETVQKPILGLYLVGWGVALIVCGISGAVNMRDYASFSYCFLENRNSFSALLVPAGILLVFVTAFFLLIRCAVIRNAVRNAEGVAQLSDGTQGTENVDLELDLDMEGDLVQPSAVSGLTGGIGIPGRTATRSLSEETSSSLMEDPERGPLTQLKAHGISTFLYLLSWIFAAVSTTKPFQQNFAHEEDLFGILYALSVSAFGMFNLFFYCVSRSDVRGQWTIMRRWFRRKNCFRTRSVSDTNHQVLPPSTAAQISVETQITSRSSSRNSSNSKSASRHSHGPKTPADSTFHPKDLSNQSNQSNQNKNVDLLVLHRQQYRSNNTVPVYELTSLGGADLFYNPHQSGVARKFFRKQRRNMVKHNNLSRHRENTSKTKSNSDVSSNIFATSSKVNNTNIHVEKVKSCTLNNPNILSENLSENYSDSEFSARLEMHHLIMGAKKHRKPKNNCLPDNDQETTEKDNMRTVSQQCSLEYSSETLSERALEKDLDLDASLACSDFTDFKTQKNCPAQLYINPLDNLHSAENLQGAKKGLQTTAEILHGTEKDLQPKLHFKEGRNPVEDLQGAKKDLCATENALHGTEKGPQLKLYTKESRDSVKNLQGAKKALYTMEESRNPVENLQGAKKGLYATEETFYGKEKDLYTTENVFHGKEKDLHSKLLLKECRDPVEDLQGAKKCLYTAGEIFLATERGLHPKLYTKEFRDPTENLDGAKKILCTREETRDPVENLQGANKGLYATEVFQGTKKNLHLKGAQKPVGNQPGAKKGLYTVEETFCGTEKGLHPKIHPEEGRNLAEDLSGAKKGLYTTEEIFYGTEKGLEPNLYTKESRDPMESLQVAKSGLYTTEIFLGTEKAPQPKLYTKEARDPSENLQAANSVLYITKKNRDSVEDSQGTKKGLQPPKDHLFKKENMSVKEEMLRKEKRHRKEKQPQEPNEDRSRDCSLRSSLSTSDMDELHGQIKPEGIQTSRSRTFATLCPEFPANFSTTLNSESAGNAESAGLSKVGGTKTGSLDKNETRV